MSTKILQKNIWLYPMCLKCNSSINITQAVDSLVILGCNCKKDRVVYGDVYGKISEDSPSMQTAHLNKLDVSLWSECLERAGDLEEVSAYSRAKLLYQVKKWDLKEEVENGFV